MRSGVRPRQGYFDFEPDAAPAGGIGGGEAAGTFEVSLEIRKRLHRKRPRPRSESGTDPGVVIMVGIVRDNLGADRQDILPRSNRKAPRHPDYRRDIDRNRVERGFAKMKQQRRSATRYDKIILPCESFLNLAAARLWLKPFVDMA